MRRLKFAWIVVVAGLWHCSGDGEKGTSPVATADPPQAPRALSVERIGDGEIWLNWQAAEGAGRGALCRLPFGGQRRGRGH